MKEKNIKKLWPYAKKYKNWMIMNALSSVFVAFLSILLSYMVKSLTDYGIKKQFDLFTVTVIIALLIQLIYGVLLYSKNYSEKRFTIKIVEDLQNDATEHLQHLPLSFFEKKHSGDLVSRLNQDTKDISGLLTNVLGIFYHPFVFIGALTYMLFISPKLLIATILLIPISAVIFDKISKPVERKSKALMIQKAKTTEIIQDTLNGIQVLKSFNLENTMNKKYETSVTEAMKIDLEIQKLNSFLSPIFLVLRFIPQLVLPIYGGYLAMTGEITIGELLAANMIIWSVFLPVESLLKLFKQIRLGAPAVSRLFEIIDYKKECFGENHLSKNESEYPIQFKHVYFSYQNDDNIILNDVSFELKKGQITALVGSSGSGKSTILKLIFGFYHQQGNLLLYGKDYNELDIQSIRSHLSLVSQDSHLFSQTIKENIAFGKLEASMNEIVEAAKAANAHEFIMKLPKQYDTLIGQVGNKLSGGQKQRISIARAILKDAPILLLDEATSALDNESEALVQDALNKYMKEKTVLIVAHRLQTIKNADEIIVIDQGSVIDKGAHHDLIINNEIYRKLYQKQFEEKGGDGNV